LIKYQFLILNSQPAFAIAGVGIGLIIFLFLGINKLPVLFAPLWHVASASSWLWSLLWKVVWFKRHQY